MTRHHVLPVLLLFLLLVAACTQTQPEEEPDLVATQVAVERAAAATLTAEAQANQPPTETPTQVPTATATAEPAALEPLPTSTPTATVPPTPIPTPTQIVIDGLSRVDGGGDENLAIHGSRLDVNQGRYVLLPGVKGETDDPVFRDQITFRVEVFDENTPRSGPSHVDGDGIASVTFNIYGPSSGDPVFVNDETQAPYCVFGGNDPLCPVATIQQWNETWPGTSNPIENGDHRAEIVIVPWQGESVQWNWNFEIARDGGQTTQPPVPQDPQRVVLRPACGNTINVQANRSLRLIHGIWANRGLQRASDNASSIQIDLVIGGQAVPGQRILPPVDTIADAICTRDYEDSYWVYNTADLAGLSPGTYNVQVTYRFTRPVDDGYGTTYTSPFTQQFTLVAQ